MRFEDWGLIPYEASCERQLSYVEEVAGGAEDVLVFCTHPPVVTLGRGAVAEDMDGWNGSTVETSRGGRATYHGPNQIVIYPILDLRRARASVRERDIHSYLRTLENSVVTGLRELGLKNAEARTTPVGGISLTGVWSGDKKIASIGIAVRKWVTYHGVAINILNDPNAHKGIRPCGFSPEVMSSLEAETGRPADMNFCKEVMRKCMQSSLS